MSISVVIPCYNQGRFLRDAIETVLRQSRPPEEVIVVDDGSTDETPRVCSEYGGALIYIRQANAGLSAARNTGIRAASSDYVQFLDADDLLRASALEESLATAARETTAAVVYGSWDEIDETGTLTAHVDATPLGDDAYHALFDPLAIGPPCRFMVRRDALIEVGLFDTGLRSCEDWDLWLRLAFSGCRFTSSPAAVAVYRRHEAAMSRNHERMWKSGSEVLRRARDRHDCAVCAVSFDVALGRWREYCYLSTLRADVRAAVHGRRLGRGLALSARAVAYDRGVVRLLAGSAVRNLRRARRVQ